MGAASESKAGERLAGAGTGTTLLGLVDLIPEKYGAVKSIAIYMCPGVGIAAGILWAISVAALKQWAGNRSLKASLADLRKLHADSVASGASDAQSLKLRGKIDELEEEVAALITDRAREVRISLKDKEPAEPSSKPSDT